MPVTSYWPNRKTNRRVPSLLYLQGLGDLAPLDILGQLEELLQPTPEDPTPIKTVAMEKDEKNKNPALIEESGLWPYIVSQDRQREGYSR